MQPAEFCPWKMGNVCVTAKWGVQQALDTQAMLGGDWGVTSANSRPLTRIF